jgi:hypothetical protein
MLASEQRERTTNTVACLLFARDCEKSFAYILSFDLDNNSNGNTIK